MKTASSTTVVAMMGELTRRIASRVASRGSIPCSRLTLTASTTTMASSTTNPMAKTNARSDMILMENPSRGNMAKVPTIETGMATSGMMVERQSCRKRKMMAMTSTRAIMRVRKMSLIPALMLRVESTMVWIVTPSGKRSSICEMRAFTREPTSTALLPGS